MISKIWRVGRGKPGGSISIMKVTVVEYGAATWRILKPKLEKLKKNSYVFSKKKLLYLEMELSGPRIKKSYILSKRSFSYI